MFFRVENSTIAFGGLVANKDVNVEVEKGQIVGLIGPNGAGKSTLFKSISGFNKIDSGHIWFDGREITNLEPNHVCKAGIACTFQKAQSFADMTLEESVLVGAYCRRKSKNRGSGLRPRDDQVCGPGRKAEREDLKIEYVRAQKGRAGRCAGHRA